MALNPIFRLYAGLIGLMSALTGCSTYSKERYHDDLVTITDRETVNYLNVHASTGDQILTLWGHEYHQVRGRNPCYLRLLTPHENEILFVTGRTWDNGLAVVHLANTDTHTVVSFPAYDSNLGENIGGNNASRQEKVVKVQDDTAIIVSNDEQGYYVHTIGLNPPAYIEFDVNTKGINGLPHHEEWPQGKSPRLIP